MTEHVREGSTAYLTATFLDKTGAQAAPASVTYRVDCLTTGAAVRAEAPIAAAAAVEIVLTPTDNAIQGQSNIRELKRVTVKATYGGDEAVNDHYDYYVDNLSHV